MLVLILCITVFVLITIFPFLLSRGIVCGSENETVLVVKSDNVKNPRYFSDSFKEKLLDAIEKNGGLNDRIFLSKEEKILYIRDKREIKGEMDRILFLRVPIELESSSTFLKEVYAEEKIKFGVSSVIRAVAGKKEVVVGEKSIIKRWADAQELLVIKKGADAGKSATSGKMVIMEKKSRFLRVYAPVIQFVSSGDLAGVYDESENQCEDMHVYMKIVRNKKYVKEGEKIRNTIITKHNLEIKHDAFVYGDIKSSGTIIVRQNSFISGNVFADGDIIIEGNVKIMGNVFSGGSMYIGTGVKIGKKGSIKSVISNNIMEICEGSTIYGYVGTERGGKVV